VPPEPITVTLAREAQTQVIVATITLRNTGQQAVQNIVLNQAKLNGIATTTALPISIAQLAPGQTTTIILRFPGSAAASGSQVPLWGSGSINGQPVQGTITVVAP
jgi:hypothetical protein